MLVPVLSEVPCHVASWTSGHVATGSGYGYSKTHAVGSSHQAKKHQPPSGPCTSATSFCFLGVSGGVSSSLQGFPEVHSHWVGTKNDETNSINILNQDPQGVVHGHPLTSFFEAINGHPFRGVVSHLEFQTPRSPKASKDYILPH